MLRGVCDTVFRYREYRLFHVIEELTDVIDPGVSAFDTGIGDINNFPDEIEVAHAADVILQVRWCIDPVGDGIDIICPADFLEVSGRGQLFREDEFIDRAIIVIEREERLIDDRVSGEVERIWRNFFLDTGREAILAAVDDTRSD